METPSPHSAPKNSSGCEVLRKSPALGPEYTIVYFLLNRNFLTQAARLPQAKQAYLPVELVFLFLVRVDI